jgi:hypothetical protein
MTKSKTVFAYQQTSNGGKRSHAPVKLFGDFAKADKSIVYLNQIELSAEEAFWTLEDLAKKYPPPNPTME